MGKLVTYSLTKIEKLLSNLEKCKDSTLETIVSDCDEHTCFSRSNAESERIGRYQMKADQELQRRLDSRRDKELAKIAEKQRIKELKTIERKVKSSLKKYRVKVSDCSGVFSSLSNSIETTVKARSNEEARVKAFRLGVANGLANNNLSQVNIHILGVFYLDYTEEEIQEELRSR